MAINPTTDPSINGRITPADLEYPYGSSINSSAPGVFDGTPYLKPRADDVFGFQQALLTRAGITPTGTPDTVLESQYLDAINQLYGNNVFNYCVNSAMWDHGWQNGFDIAVSSANSLQIANYGPDQYLFWHFGGGSSPISVRQSSLTVELSNNPTTTTALSALELYSDNSNASNVFVGNVMPMVSSGSYRASVFAWHGTSVFDFPVLITVVRVDSNRNVLATYTLGSGHVTSTPTRFDIGFNVTTSIVTPVNESLICYLTIPGEDFSASNSSVKFAGFCINKSKDLLDYTVETETAALPRVNMYFETSYFDGVPPGVSSTPGALYTDTNTSGIRRSRTVEYKAPRMGYLTNVLTIYGPNTTTAGSLDISNGTPGPLVLMVNASRTNFSFLYEPTNAAQLNTPCYFHYVSDSRV